MKNIFVIVATIFITTGCTNNEQASGSEKDTTTSVTVAAPPVAQLECFVYQTSKDTVSLNLTGNSNAVKGNLLYSYFEKDRNSGTLAGQFRGDTLIADYTFNSEGKSSIRQVAFLRTTDGLIEGYGDVEEKDGRMQFKNTSTLNFGGQMILKKTNCP